MNDTAESVLGFPDDTVPELQKPNCASCGLCARVGPRRAQRCPRDRIDEMIQTLSDLNAKLEGKVFPGIAETGAYNN